MSIEKILVVEVDQQTDRRKQLRALCNSRLPIVNSRGARLQDASHPSQEFTRGASDLEVSIARLDAFSEQTCQVEHTHVQPGRQAKADWRTPGFIPVLYPRFLVSHFVSGFASNALGSGDVNGKGSVFTLVEFSYKQKMKNYPKQCSRTIG